MTAYARSRRRFPRLRQSTLQEFASCQLQAGFDLRFSIAPTAPVATSGWTSHRASAGRVAHATIARALKHMQTRGQESIPPELMMDFYAEELRQDGRPVAETFSIPAHEDRDLRQTLRKWARENVITIADLVDVEIRLDFDVPYSDGSTRTLTGQLDCLLFDRSGRHATVPDWKDTWKLPPQRRNYDATDDDGENDGLSQEGYFQQRFYAADVFMNFRAIESVTLREFYLKRSQPREATLWRRDLPDILDYLAATAERFDRCYEEASEPAKGRRSRRKPLATTRQWGEPSPGTHCSYCPGALDCPTMPEVREGGGIATPEQAMEGAGQLLVARRAVKKLERDLGAWSDRNGPVRVRDAKRDRFFGHVMRTETIKPTLTQVNAAMLAGEDPRKLFRTRSKTAFTDYSPEDDVSLGLDDADVLQMFERAAAQAGRKR